MLRRVAEGVLVHESKFVQSNAIVVQGDAGDMLSDVFIPMLDLSTADPIEDYLAALRLLEGVAADVEVVIPGQVPDDPRIGPSAKPGWEWVSDVHTGQAQQLAERNERGGTQ